MVRRRAKRVCAEPGCPVLVDGGRCLAHQRETDRARGTSAERGYGGAGHQRFRTAVLRRDLTCVVCTTAPSTVADHFPVSRRDLVAQGFDPNDPAHGRGLCHRCHSVETARHQPGGWHMGHAE